MKIRWKLRMAAAQREVWTGAQLRRLLAERAGLELSSASVSALLTKEPSQVKLSTLLALCTALECTPERPVRGRHHTRRAPAVPAPVAERRGESRCRARPFDAADLRPEQLTMGKKQRDCAGCGAPVGYHRPGALLPVLRRIREAAAKAPCPGCGMDRVLHDGHRAVCAVLPALHRVRRPGPGPGRHRVPALPAQRRTGGRASSPARDAAGPGLLRAETGWCGTCSRPAPQKDPPRICAVCGQLRRHAGFGMCTLCWQRTPTGRRSAGST